MKEITRRHVFTVEVERTSGSPERLPEIDLIGFVIETRGGCFEFHGWKGERRFYEGYGSQWSVTSPTGQHSWHGNLASCARAIAKGELK